MTRGCEQYLQRWGPGRDPGQIKGASGNHEAEVRLEPG